MKMRKAILDRRRWFEMTVEEILRRKIEEMEKILSDLTKQNEE